MIHLRHFFVLFFFAWVSGQAIGQSAWKCGTDTRISLEGTSETSVLTCAEDGRPSILTFKSSSSALPYSLIVTDEAGIIHLVTNRLSIDFDQFAIGNYRVYVLSYLGHMSAKAGLNINKDPLGKLCYGLSANYIRVGHLTPNGGQIQFAGGGTSRLVCTNNEKPDVLAFLTTSTDPQYRFFLTDENNVLLEVLDGNSMDFNLAEGVRRIWGASFVGDISVQPGEVLTEALIASECFGLSGNFLEVIPTQPQGGQISFNGLGTRIEQCSNDDRNAVFPLSSTSSSLASYLYLLTDGENRLIRVLDEARLDASALVAGNYRIWGMSYLGTTALSPGIQVTEAALSDDCFELSGNFLELEIFDLDPGAIRTQNNETRKVLCLNDSEEDKLGFLVTPFPGFEYALVITDENNQIVSLASAASAVDFAALPGNKYRVYGLAYQGNLLIASGTVLGNQPLAEGCFAITSSFVEVEKKNPDGGTVKLEDGTDSIHLCYLSGNTPGGLRLTTTGKNGENYLFLLTDNNDNIQTISADGQFDLGSFPGGTYRIYGLSYTGALSFPSGANVNNTNFSNECADLSDNFVTVTKTNLDGASISFQDESSEALLCTDGSGVAGVNLANTAVIVQQYAYLLTDSNNKVLRIFNADNRVTLNKDEEGDFRVWGIAYSGTLLTQIGSNLEQTIHSDQCFEVSKNFVVLKRRNVEGGAVQLAGNAASFLGCFDGVGSSPALEAQFSRNPIGEKSVFLVTDANNVVRAISQTNQIAFNGFAPGNYRVWHLAYSGDLKAEVGQGVGLIPLSTECYDLSDNFIPVTLERVEGAMVSLSDGTTEREICLGQESGFVSFKNTNTATGTYRYVLTNGKDEMILALIGNSFDISVAPAGDYRVYGISYTGNLLLTNGKNIRTTPISDRCFALSDNFISIRNELVRGGSIFFNNGAIGDRFVCPDDVAGSLVSFSKAATVGPAYAYIVTDEQNLIAAVSTSDTVNFAALPEGIYRVWGLAYSGKLNAAPGVNPAGVLLADGCFSLSVNSLIVRRTSPLGGTISLPDGSTSLALCPESTLPKVIQVEGRGGQGGQETFILTDSNNVVVQTSLSGQFVLDSLPKGSYFVRTLIYNGELLAKAGVDADTASLATSCYSLSTNAVDIRIESPKAGTLDVTPINLLTGNNPSTCLNGASDPNNVLLVRAFGSSKTPYLILATDTLSQLLFSIEVKPEIIPNDPFSFYYAGNIPFDSLGGGDFLFYGLAYTGNLNLAPGKSINGIALSDECFSLTSAARFTLLEADGGLVEADGFEGDTVFVCPGDQVQDSIFFNTSSQGYGAGYRFFLTNAANLVLSELPGNVQNFENAGFRELRIWGGSYTGNYASPRNKNLLTATLSDACFDLSDNFITIIREAPEGNTISTSDNKQELYFCPGRDGSTVQLKTGVRAKAGFVYILTDAAGVVREVSRSGNIDLKAHPVGVYTVYGLSYTGRLLFRTGDTLNVQAPLSSSCFVLASNQVKLTRGGEVDGKSLSTLFGDTLFYTCPGDGVSDLVIIFPPQPEDGSQYRLIITDDQNRIIFPEVQNSLIDFDASEPGVYRVWGVSYTGQFVGQFGMRLGEGALSSDCYDLSDNFITVVAEIPRGGALTTGDGQTSVNVVRADGKPDKYGFIRTGGSPGTPVRYLLTDIDNVILAISADTFDFDQLAVGEYRVWGVTYTGIFLAAPGADADLAPLSDNCFSLTSNFITINVLASSGLSNAWVATQGPDKADRPRLYLNAAPNPVADVLQIGFAVENLNAGEVQLQLFSLNGELLRVQKIQPLAGYNTALLDMGALSDGIYFLRLFHQGAQETLRVVKITRP